MEKIAPMITVHISPSEEKVYIDHVPGYGTVVLSPQDAYSVLMRLQERRTDLHALAFANEQQDQKRDNTNEFFI